MPEVGETGWGQLVSNNFAIIDNAIGNGTRILHIPIPNTFTNTITSDIFEKCTYYDDNNVYIASFGSHIIFESIPKPQHSCRLMIISVNGNATFNGNIDIYPTTLQSETPPGTPETNIYNNNINFVQNSYEITLEYIANGNNSKFSMNHEDYLNFINETLPPTSSQTNKSYQLSIPHAITAGGYVSGNYGTTGTAGTAENTCNGGGGGSVHGDGKGGTGCIFGQYAGANSSNANGYGYGSGASNKYRCALIFVVYGNLTIAGTITHVGGDNPGGGSGGYGGGALYAGGGGAPVFIYYTGTYVNNGTINTAGGNGDLGGSAGAGGAGGIKTTQITLQ